MDRWEEMGILFAIITRAMMTSEKGIVQSGLFWWEGSCMDLLKGVYLLGTGRY